MRKLKNKVIESARKLISLKIREESDTKFDGLHKLGGAISQELNIKFNFWFHLQKFKDIFKFKCSSKYSINSLFDNFSVEEYFVLISRLKISLILI